MEVLFYCTVQCLADKTAKTDDSTGLTVIDAFDYVYICFTNDLFISWFILRWRQKTALEGPRQNLGVTWYGKPGSASLYEGLRAEPLVGVREG